MFVAILYYVLAFIRTLDSHITKTALTKVNVLLMRDWRIFGGKNSSMIGHKIGLYYSSLLIETHMSYPL